MSLAILPGSFDPMTLGHRALAFEVAEQYDEVVVAVMINRDKTYWLSLEERVRVAELTLKGIPNVRVIADEGMLIDLFDRLGADAVCKGWRNGEDLAYEESMAEWNRAHNPRFVTRLFRAKEEWADCSSTRVRELLQAGGDPSPLLAPDAYFYLREKQYG